jgi:hypothetical protein
MAFPFDHGFSQRVIKSGDESDFHQEEIEEIIPAIKPNNQRFFQYLDREMVSSSRHQYPFLAKSDYVKIYESLKTGYEIGGTFKLGDEHKDLRIEHMSDGRSNSVDVPLSRYEFHTHPAGCPSKAHNCALGTPSIKDMENILERSSKGNEIHSIFARDGVFVVKVKRGPNFKKKSFGQAVLGDLRKVQNDFTFSSMTYKEFRGAWMDRVGRGDVFEVDLFPLGVGVYFKPPTQML